MCYFITVGVDKEKIYLVKERTPRSISLVESNNKSIKNAIPDNYLALNVIKGICSCDLYNSMEDYVDKKMKFIKKMKRKKWSNSKMERVLDNYKKLESSKQYIFIGIDPVVRDVIRLSTNICNQTFLLIHWYSGDIDRETTEFKSEVKNVYEEIDFDSVPADVLLHIVKD
jgi:hypothetical protein